MTNQIAVEAAYIIVVVVPRHHVRKNDRSFRWTDYHCTGKSWYKILDLSLEIGPVFEGVVGSRPAWQRRAPSQGRRPSATTWRPKPLLEPASWETILRM